MPLVPKAGWCLVVNTSDRHYPLLVWIHKACRLEEWFLTFGFKYWTKSVLTWPRTFNLNYQSAVGQAFECVWFFCCCFCCLLDFFSTNKRQRLNFFQHPFPLQYKPQKTCKPNIYKNGLRCVNFTSVYFYLIMANNQRYNYCYNTI